jgi:hypothetical protein
MIRTLKFNLRYPVATILGVSSSSRPGESHQVGRIEEVRVSCSYIEGILKEPNARGKKVFISHART